MFQLTENEKENVVANCDHLQNLKYSPYLPYAFTEYGSVMLANVLNSERAIEASIRIVEIYIKMRELVLTHKDILLKLEQLEKKIGTQDENIAMIFQYLRKFIDIQEKPRKAIGFKTPGKSKDYSPQSLTFNIFTSILPPRPALSPAMITTDIISGFSRAISVTCCT